MLLYLLSFFSGSEFDMLCRCPHCQACSPLKCTACCFDINVHWGWVLGTGVIQVKAIRVEETDRHEACLQIAQVLGLGSKAEGKSESCGGAPRFTSDSVVALEAVPLSVLDEEVTDPALLTLEREEEKEGGREGMGEVTEWLGRMEGERGPVFWWEGGS